MSIRMTASTLHILTHEFYPKIGGAGIFVEETAQAASKLGLSPTVWAPEIKQGKDPIPKWQFEVHPLPYEGTQGWINRLRLARELSGSKEILADSTLHLAEPGPMRAWMYLSKIYGWKCRKLILTFHGSEVLLLTSLPYRKSFLRKLIHQAHRIHVLSEYNRSLLQRHFPEIPVQKWCVTGAAPRHLGKPSAEDYSKLPVNDGKLVILTVGRIHPRKGHHRVLEALGALPDEMRKQLTYWISGPVVRSHYARQLETLARRHRIDMVFLGSLTPTVLKAAYEKADIFTMTSGVHYRSIEGLGLVYLEAGTEGLPIVATHTGGVSEVVYHQRNGLIVQVDDGDALSKAYRQLIENPDLRKKLGKSGRELSAQCSWENVAEQIYCN